MTILIPLVFLLKLKYVINICKISLFPYGRNQSFRILTIALLSLFEEKKTMCFFSFLNIWAVVLIVAVLFWEGNYQQIFSLKDWWIINWRKSSSLIFSFDSIESNISVIQQQLKREHRVLFFSSIHSIGQYYFEIDSREYLIVLSVKISLSLSLDRVRITSRAIDLFFDK